ncbi:MAG: metallopeptidase TldD-related protein [Mariprofundales bacterium]
MSENLQKHCQILLDLAKKQGAYDADALAVHSKETNLSVRSGALESIERNENRGLGLRICLQKDEGLAFASASTSDISDAGLATLAEQVVGMAKLSAADADALAPSGATHPDANDMNADTRPIPRLWTIEEAKQAAQTAEESAFAHSSLISHCEGVQAGFGSSKVWYACADGFSGQYASSNTGLSLSAIASQSGVMERDYDYSSKRNPDDLKDATSIGINAADRAVQRLGASSMASTTLPVLLEPRVANSILGHLLAAINGRSIVHGTSFLNDAAGTVIFPEFLHIEDNPQHLDANIWRSFDGEGTRTQKHKIIDAGRLTGFLTDRYAAGRLQCKETGHAQRGLTGDIGIGAHFSSLQAGTQSFDELLASMNNGVLVTELLGFGVNAVTGDYSRGAAGFLIENGKIIRPLSEITLAGNLRDIFANILAVGSDVQIFGNKACPSMLLGEMTIAGQGS